MESLEQTRSNNITEYIIHLYQAEEMLREYNFDLQKVEDEYIAGKGGSEEEKSAELAWLKELAATMKQDGVEQEGHVSNINETVKELSELHFHLLKSDRVYRGHFDQAKLHINRHLQTYGGELTNPIQICLDGISLYKRKRAQQEEIDELTMESMRAFKELCSYLSYRFKSR